MMMSITKFVIPATFSFICSDNIPVVQTIRLQFRKKDGSCDSSFRYDTQTNNECVPMENQQGPGSFLQKSNVINSGRLLNLWVTGRIGGGGQIPTSGSGGGLTKTPYGSPVPLNAYEDSAVSTRFSSPGETSSGVSASSGRLTQGSAVIYTPRSSYTGESPMAPGTTPGSSPHESPPRTPTMPGARPENLSGIVNAFGTSFGSRLPGPGPSRNPSTSSTNPSGPPTSSGITSAGSPGPQRFVVNPGSSTLLQPGDGIKHAPRLEDVTDPRHYDKNFHVSADPNAYPGKIYRNTDVRKGFAGSPNEIYRGQLKEAPRRGAAGEWERRYLDEVIHAGPIPNGLPTGLPQKEGEVKLETTMCIPPGAPPLPSNQCRATSNIPNRQGPGYTTKLHSCVSVKSANGDDHLCVTQHSLNVLLDRFGSISKVDKAETRRYNFSGVEYRTYEYTLPQFGAQPWPYINEDKQCMKCVRVGAGTETVPEK